MDRIRGWRRYLLLVPILSALWVSGSALVAQSPEAPAEESAQATAGEDGPEIQLVQEAGSPQGAPGQPLAAPGGSAPADLLRNIRTTPTPAAGGPGGIAPPSGDGGPRASDNQSTGPGAVGGASVIPGGTGAQAVNATDAARLLTNSTASTGVEIQQRNPIQSDPRVRGYRVPQLVTWGNYSFFLPARLDLDTAVDKFDPTSVRDITVLKGPYTVRLGPGLAFLDIATFDSPRNPDGWKYEGRTLVNYQTNGQRFNLLQALGGGDADWGFRAIYDFRVGNDYKAGNGQDVPSSYNSQSVNGAVGVNLTENQKVEFKVLRLYQHDLEFAGLYFDINRLDTEAYSMRYTWKDQPFFDLLRLDLWDNYTRANGDTTRGAKQAFLANFLANVFSSPGKTRPVGSILDRFSSTDFNEGSRGYRLAVTWGEQGGPQLTAGSDLNYVHQELIEAIRLQQIGTTFNDPSLGPANLTQNLGLPYSHSVDPGLFLDLRLPVNERLTLTGGLRGDLMYTNSDARAITGNTVIVAGTQNNPVVPGQPPVPGQGPVGPLTNFDPILFSSRPFDNNLARHFTTMAAFVTVDYKLDEHWTSFAKFGYAQRPPSLTELYADGPFVAVLQQGLNRLVGDPHLNAERAKQVDIGINGTYQKFRMGANGFYSWIGDYITFDLNQAALGQISQVVFTNTPLATLAGGELYAEADATSWLTPFVTASYVQGRDLTHTDDLRSPNLVSSRRTGATEPLPGIPPLELRSGFRLHAPGVQPPWAIEFTARSVMGQNLVASSLNEVKTGGFTVLYLRGYWQATDKLLLTAGVENLGDKFYREHLDPLAGGQLFRPGTNLYLGAQFRY